MDAEAKRFTNAERIVVREWEAAHRDLTSRVMQDPDGSEYVFVRCGTEPDSECWWLERDGVSITIASPTRGQVMVYMHSLALGLSAISDQLPRSAKW